MINIKMKKLISTILIMSFMVSLVACGNKETPNPNNQPENPGQITEIETKPAIDVPKPADPSTSDKNDEPAPELPAVYTETNLSEVIMGSSFALYLGERNSSVYDVQEVDSFVVSGTHGERTINVYNIAFKKQYAEPHYYYFWIPVSVLNEDGSPKEFSYQYIQVKNSFEENRDTLIDFYNRYYADFNICKLEFEQNSEPVIKEIEKITGTTVQPNEVHYINFFPIYEGGVGVFQYRETYYIFDVSTYSMNNFEPSIYGCKGSVPMGRFRTAYEAAMSVNFAIEDITAAISYDPYGFFMAKRVDNNYSAGFFGRNSYYEGKAPDLGPDFKAVGTKTIYNVFTCDNQYVKTVAKKDASTFNGLKIGDSKDEIFKHFNNFHEEPCKKITEEREYYWYCSNYQPIGLVLVIIVENDKVVELQSVYLEATDNDHKPHSYSNEFPGDKESAKEIELTEEMKQFFGEAYGFFKNYYLGRFDYADSDVKDSNGGQLYAVLDEDKNQFTIESLRENCEKYYAKATVESMVSLNNVISHDLYHFIDNKLYIYDGGIGDDITVGGMKAVKLFELADGSRVFEIELERFSEIDLSVVEPDTVYFTMVNENGRYVFDNMYCVDH